jgi:rhamnopyranosyl-N-acetylglucosaminyl-diphospho-decaprenol beta-1,3/1,4-galactofuranosyltransferase
MTPSVCAVVVTYDRPKLLARCLHALQRQTVPLSSILVVDNASPASTCRMLEDSFSGVEVLRLEENLGGAGGFRAGMQRAFAMGSDWVWVMDDDATPTPEGFERLLPHMRTRTDSLVALASRLVDGTVTPFGDVGDQGTVREISKAMFVGFAVPSVVASTIGLPREDYFIYGDDSEFCIRLRRSGGRVFEVTGSVVEHVDWAANPSNVTVNLFGRRWLVYPAVPPWKGYYLARNRILTGRVHGLKYLAKGFTQSLGYLILSFVFAPGSVTAVARGFADGLRGRFGKVAAPS